MNKKTLALLCIVLIVVGIAWLVLSYVRYLPQWDYGQGIAKRYLAAKNNPYPEKVNHLRVSFTVTRVAKLTVNG